MNAIIPAGSNIILDIGTIGLGATINGVSIGAMNIGIMNATGTAGMTMTKLDFGLVAAGRNLTPPSLRRRQVYGLFNNIARARHREATAAHRRATAM
jgi:hypothetical protein